MIIIIMGYCVAPNCKSHSKNGCRLFRFPRNKDRRDKWVQNCGRDKWNPTEHSQLCELHFEESQFESKRADGRKLLKWNAVPTVFNISSPPKTSCHRKPRQERGLSSLVNATTCGQDSCHLCRLCASMSEELVPVFGKEGMELNLLEKIHTTLPIRMTPEDALPVTLCSSCVWKLQMFHEFSVGCLEADAKLRLILGLDPAGEDAYMDDCGATCNTYNDQDEISIKEEEIQVENNPILHIINDHNYCKITTEIETSEDMSYIVQDGVESTLVIEDCSGGNISERAPGTLESLRSDITETSLVQDNVQQSIPLTSPFKMEDNVDIAEYRKMQKQVAVRSSSQFSQQSAESLKWRAFSQEVSSDNGLSFSSVGLPDQSVNIPIHPTLLENSDKVVQNNKMKLQHITEPSANLCTSDTTHTVSYSSKKRPRKEKHILIADWTPYSFSELISNSQSHRVNTKKGRPPNNKFSLMAASTNRVQKNKKTSVNYNTLSMQPFVILERLDSEQIKMYCKRSIENKFAGCKPVSKKTVKMIQDFSGQNKQDSKNVAHFQTLTEKTFEAHSQFSGLERVAMKKFTEHHILSKKIVSAVQKAEDDSSGLKEIMNKKYAGHRAVSSKSLNLVQNVKDQEITGTYSNGHVNNKSENLESSEKTKVEFAVESECLKIVEISSQELETQFGNEQNCSEITEMESEKSETLFENDSSKITVSVTETNTALSEESSTGISTTTEKADPAKILENIENLIKKNESILLETAVKKLQREKPPPAPKKPEPKQKVKKVNEPPIPPKEVCEFLKCAYCTLSFKSDTLLCEHTREVHMLTEECQYCKKKFSRIKFQKHLDTHIKTFLCDKCGESFKTKESFENHIRKHNSEHNQVQYLCNICGNIFKRIGGFRQHLGRCGKSKRNELKTCPHCGRSFKNRTNYLGHLRIHTNERPYRCSFCEETFRMYRHKSMHEARHINARKHKCPTCGKGFNRRQHMTQHLRVHFPNNNVCQVCDETFTHRLQLRAHLRYIHNIDDIRACLQMEGSEDVFICHICGRCYSSRATLNQHIKLHGCEVSYTCEFCEKTFANRMHFQAHLRNFHNVDDIRAYLKKEGSKEGTFTCHLCGHCLSTKKNLDQHIKRHAREVSYTCELCKIMFNTKAELGDHEQSQHNGMSFSCSVCGKTYVQHSQLLSHERGHSAKKPYQCSFCSEGFTLKHSLIIHERKHKGENPYKCKHCPKAFVSAASLNAHSRNHSDHRPFRCEICDKAFKRIYDRKIHLRIHTNERPFVCTVCGRGFRQNGDRRKHELGHFKEKDVKEA